jgi:hypothetical protein
MLVKSQKAGYARLLHNCTTHETILLPGAGYYYSKHTKNSYLKPHNIYKNPQIALTKVSGLSLILVCFTFF